MNGSLYCRPTYRPYTLQNCYRTSRSYKNSVIEHICTSILLRRFCRQNAEKVAPDSDDEDEDLDDPSNQEEALKPNPKLEAGRQLPPSLEDYPPEYVGKPLEDLDEFYHNQKVGHAQELLY